MNFEKQIVVIDNGTGNMKVGFSGVEKKPIIFPSVIGRPKYQVVIPNTNNGSEVYMGDDVNSTSKRGMFKLKYPIQHGIIQNWDDMELLWKHSYSQLKISPNENPVLLTQPNLNPTKQRKKIFEIFFEKYQVPALFIAAQGVLSLFAAGRYTGVVLDSGDGVTNVVPVYEGYSIENATQRIDLGGRDVTYHLRDIMRKSGINLNTSAELEVARTIKQKYCSFQPRQQEKKGSDKYVLPDGQQVEFHNNERDAGDILFNPQKVGLEHPSVVQLVSQSLEKVDINLRTNLYSEIVLSGGNTMFDGFPERFVKEIKSKLPSESKPRVFAPSNRATMCWQGGSILAGLSNFKDMWITKKEYEQSKDHSYSKKFY